MPKKFIYVTKSNLYLLLTLAVVILVAVALFSALVARGPKCKPGQDLDGTPSEVDFDIDSYSSGSPHSTSPTSPPLQGPHSDISLVTMSESKNGTFPWDSYRLPDHITPLLYELVLHPNLNTGLFSGTVDILINITKATDYLIVHAKFLNVTRSVVRQDGHKEEMTIRESFCHEKNEFWVVRLVRDVDPGRYHLYLEFSGSLVNGIVGFYKSDYLDPISGQTRSLATTKFEPTYARRAFPCFDEPALKARYKTTLIHEEGYIALSNMPPIETVPYSENGLKRTSFQESVEMSTYLACFIVCDFDKLTTFTQDGKPFSVYSTPDQVNHTDYALKLGSKIQDHYTDYFNIGYPLPKQGLVIKFYFGDSVIRFRRFYINLIAIPDFVSGAMENWGLITFREVNLLVNPKETSSSDVERVSTVVAHELAHMWFGNLVTMQWWDDLWLNEGFANFMEYMGASYAQPDWNLDEVIAIDTMHPVMDLDASANSHPIIQPVEHPDEITEIFDSITYSKGTSVIHMLNAFMGSDDFRKGIQNYLRKFSFGNARTADLWKELEATSTKKLDITTIMDSWTKQMGFPVINVSIDPLNQQQIVVSQERFFLLPDDALNLNKSRSPFRYLWEVPLTYRNSNGAIEIEWLHKEEKKTFTLPFVPHKPLKFNVNQTGFYRVNYETSVWNSFIKILRDDHLELSCSDRSNLLNDVFNLASGSYVNYSLALESSQYLAAEEDYLPWSTAAVCISTITNRIQNTKAYPKWRQHVLKITHPLYKKLGWEDTGNHLTRMLRPIVLNLMCENGYEECLIEARDRLRSWMNGTTVPSNLRLIVYEYGMRSWVGSSAWEFMWEKYRNASAAQEKTKLLRGLSSTREPWLISKYLQFVKDETKIRGQDVFSVLRYISRNPIGESMVWNFVRQDWEYLVGRFTLNDRYLGRLIPSITVGFDNTFRLQEMRDFFEKYPDAGAGAAARKNALDKTIQNIDWLKRHAIDIEKWLDIYY